MAAPSNALAALIRQVRLVDRQVHVVAQQTPDVARLRSIDGLVLQVAAEQPGIAVGAIAERLGMQVANTSAAVRTLCEKKLLRREPDPQDRRVSTVWPTESAEQAMQVIEQRWLEVLLELGIEDEELAQATELLARIGARLEEQRLAAERQG